MKSIIDKHLNIGQEYYNLPSVSHSDLVAWRSLNPLNGTSDALTLGSLVDSMTLGDEGEVTERFLIGGSLTPAILEVCKLLSDDPDDDEIVSAITMANYAPTWKMPTKLAKIKDALLVYQAMKGKTVVSQEMFNQATEMNKSLLSNDTIYSFINRSKHQIQLEEVINGVPCRCMTDMLIIDDNNQTIQVVDLKTTSSLRNFTHSFYKFGYDIQAIMYNTIVKLAITDCKEEGYTVLPFKFAVVDSQTFETGVFKVTSEPNSQWKEDLKSVYWGKQHPSTNLRMSDYEQLEQNGFIEL